MIADEAALRELDELWEPVYPHLARHLLRRSGVEGARLLEIGPFAGGIALGVLWQSEAFVATVLAGQESVLRRIEERAAAGGYVSRLTTRRTPLEPLPEPDRSFDLVAARGAFFFLTPTLLREMTRVLRPGGLAWIGGGFGAQTPADVIAPLAARSRVLNAALGKRQVLPEELAGLAAAAGLGERASIVEQGGLWLEVRG